MRMESQQAGVAALAREIEDFVAAGGWDQPPQLFALVPTAALLDEQPEPRLVAAVLREGERACVMRLRGIGTDETVDEIVESPDLAPNLVEALKATLLP